jgi:hypothetical protein
VRKEAAATLLLKGRWRIPPEGPECRVLWPHVQRLFQVDDAWPPLRTPSDLAHGWRWIEICKRAREFFLVQSSKGENLGIWASNNPTCEVEGKRFYVLSKIESSPKQRSAGIGHMMMMMCAFRAQELGCSGVLLAAVDELKHVYTAYGGVRREVENWFPPRGLNSWVFEGDSLLQLREDYDEFLLEEGQ